MYFWRCFVACVCLCVLAGPLKAAQQLSAAVKAAVTILTAEAAGNQDVWRQRVDNLGLTLQRCTDELRLAAQRIAEMDQHVDAMKLDMKGAQGTARKVVDGVRRLTAQVGDLQKAQDSRRGLSKQERNNEPAA